MDQSACCDQQPCGNRISWFANVKIRLAVCLLCVATSCSPTAGEVVIVPLKNGYVLWKAPSGEVGISKETRQSKDAAIPSSIKTMSVVGDLIVATRDAQMPNNPDEYWILDTDRHQVEGPLTDEAFLDRMADRDVKDPIVFRTPKSVLTQPPDKVRH